MNLENKMEMKGNPKIIREMSSGWSSTQLITNKHSEWHITITPLPNESPAALFERLGKWVKEKNSVIVRQEIFGGLKYIHSILQLLEKKFGVIDWPIIWTQGSSIIDDTICGINLIAVEGTPVSIVKYQNRIVGRSFSDGVARHLILGDLRPTKINAEKSEQTRELFEQIEKVLKIGLMDYSNVVRTWFFIDDILSWYTPFNIVRTDFYKKHGVFDRIVPASTGIAGKNIYKSALLAGVWAVQPEDESFYIKEVPSPLQCPAPCYGSSFSRAIEFGTSNLRRLFISGTASIQLNGSSAHINDIAGQVDLTMRVVEAILKSRGMNFNDTTRSTAYFKNIEHKKEMESWFSKHNIANVPLVITQADICRDELLFEIEVDAISTNPV